MNGYEKRSSQKRVAILQAAQALFAQKGISGVSVTEIAARAGVSRVTLFKYFGDKDTLARQAMQAGVEHLVAEYREILNAPFPFHEKLLLLFRTRLSGREKIGESFIQATAWEDPELRALIYDLSRGAALPVVLAFLEEGREAGYIDSRIDNEALLVYLSAFEPIVQNPAYIKKGPAFQESIFNLFMGGMVRGWYGMLDANRDA